MSQAAPIPGLIPGFDPDTVEGLREARRAVPHFDLLRGICAGGEDEFVLRFGAVADLVHADQTLWTLDALERRLCWMDTERIHATVRVLRRAGWLETIGNAYRLTSDGLAVYATLARLGSLHTGRDDSLAMGVFDLEASTSLDEDTRPALRHLQHHLRRAVEDVEAAVKSQSELKVQDAREKLDKNLQWSERARLLLDRLDVDDHEGYRAGQRLGRDLSELHRWHSVIQRVLDELGRNAVPVSQTGVSANDVGRFMARLSVDEILDRFGDGVSLAVWPLVLITDNVVSAAEYELTLARDGVTPNVAWLAGRAESAEVGAPPPSEGELAYRRFEGDLASLSAPVSLERFLLDADFPRTCYRTTLLALEDEVGTRATVEVDEGPAMRLFSDAASEISRGRVLPATRPVPDSATLETPKTPAVTP